MTEFLTHELPVNYVLEQKFQVIKSLGQGAFGATYLVKHKHFDTLNVVKEYLPQFSVRVDGHIVSPKSQKDVESFQWGLKRFIDEAKLLYKLSHPNIVKVIDLFQTNGTAYFVMPYLGGDTFQNWIDYHPIPKEDELLAIFIPILEGLKYIHSKGLLHRDIKPDNILITDDNTPVLIDFGSARNAIGQKSQLLTRVLTPHFAPIEQYSNSNNHTYSPALDLYSLSTCMYQAIVGNYPPPAINRVEEDTIIKLQDVDKFRIRYSNNFLKTIDKNLNLHAKDRDQTGSAMQNNLLGYYEAQSSRPSNNTKESQEKEAYKKARERDTIESYLGFIRNYPYTERADLAQGYLNELQNKELGSKTKGGFGFTGYIGTDQSDESSEGIPPLKEDYQTYEAKFLSTKGRIGRLRYAAYNGMLTSLATFSILPAMLLIEINEIFYLISFVSLTVIFAVFQCIFIARRLHDLNKTGWLMFLPLIGIYAFFAKGTKGENKYGLPDHLNDKNKLIVWAISPLILLALLGIALYIHSIV